MNRLRFALAIAGFALALLSIARDDHLLAWAAVALLAASLLVRLVARTRK
jgi:hypothetical protein